MRAQDRDPSQLDPERLRALKNGDDQHGVRRTWAQVGAMLGYSHDYVAAIAGGRPTGRILTRLEIDPRELLPHLRQTMSDEQVKRWNANPYCLCGCGGPTRQEPSNQARVPRGAYRLFIRGHFNRLPDRRRQWQAILSDQQVRERMLASRYSRKLSTSCHGAFLSGLLKEWKLQDRRNNYEQLARDIGMSAQTIRTIVHTPGLVDRVIMARILVGLGEPLRPELATALSAWLKDQQGQDVPSSV